MKKIILFAVLLSCFVLYLTVYVDYLIPSTWNYRITIEIETPEGTKSGSAVRQVQAQLQYPLNPDIGEVISDVFGEAVVIDLGERGVIFALINRDSYNEVYKAFPKSFKSSSERVKYYRNLKTGTMANLSDNIPEIVMYEETKDPSTRNTVFWQKPKKGIDKFEDIFGDGVFLKSVNIEMTDQKMTWGVVDKFMPIFDGGRYRTKYKNFKRKSK